jgi:hypothetical protein
MGSFGNFCFLNHGWTPINTDFCHRETPGRQERAFSFFNQGGLIPQNGTAMDSLSGNHAANLHDA